MKKQNFWSINNLSYAIISTITINAITFRTWKETRYINCRCFESVFGPWIALALGMAFLFILIYSLSDQKRSMAFMYSLLIILTLTYLVVMYGIIILGSRFIPIDSGAEY